MISTHTLTLKQNSLTEKRTTGRITRKSAPRGVSLPAGILAATLAVGAAYLFTLNTQSTHGYALRALEAEKSQLTQENRALDRTIGELSSIGVIETAAQSMEFVAAGDVRYYTGQTGVAALERMQP